MKGRYWVVLGVIGVAALGGQATGAGSEQAPTSTTSTTLDPTQFHAPPRMTPGTAPTGGEPGIAAGPPNPGYCTPGTDGTDVRRRVPAQGGGPAPCR